MSDIQLKPVISISGVTKSFGLNQVLKGVSLDIAKGQVVAIIGPSGSGKTTLLRCINFLEEYDGGSIKIEGIEVGYKDAIGERRRRSDRDLAKLRADAAMVFQQFNLFPHLTATQNVMLGLVKSRGKSKSEACQIAHRWLSRVGLAEKFDAMPTQLSGGLKQRVAISRAFAGAPQLVVCDEPTSALDVSVQATILNLLVDLQKQDGTSFIFISHDLGVVRYISDKIAVLYLGRVVEFGDSNQVFGGPHHPYTAALLSSVPNIDGTVRKRIPLTGSVPSPSNPPSGCVLNPRCPRMAGSGVEGLCTSVEPELKEVEPGHFMRCHIPFDQLRTTQA